MYHTLALTKSLTASTLEELTVVSDGIIQVQNAHFLPPMDLNVYAAIAFGTDLQRVRVTTPRLRQISPIFLRPFQPTLIGANDANAIDLTSQPLRLRAQEEIIVEALQDNAGAQRGTVVLFLGERLQPAPPGDVFTIRATSTTACVANTWTQLSYTLDSQLPQGRYAVVGVEHVSTNSQAIRLTFDNQFFRPGFPGLGDVNHRLPLPFLQRFLGALGHFVTYSLPRVEVLANGTDNSHEVYFHVVPMG